jgi:hypothetical protein
MDCFQQNYLHNTNGHTPQEIRSFQMIEDLPLAHLAQTGCNINNIKWPFIYHKNNTNKGNRVEN